MAFLQEAGSSLLTAQGRTTDDALPPNLRGAIPAQGGLLSPAPIPP